MNSIDDRLHDAAKAIHDGYANNPGPGPAGIARTSRARRNRRTAVTLTVVAVAGLVGYGWSNRAIGVNEIDVATQDPNMVTAAEIESCRSAFEIIYTDEMRDAVLADTGVDLADVEPQNLSVAISVRSTTSEAGIVGLEGQGVFLGCTTDPSDNGHTGGIDFPDTSKAPGPSEVWVLDVRGSGGTTAQGPTFSAIGEVGADVVGVDAVLADGTTVAGRVSDGWFGVEGPALSEDLIGEFDLVWTLTDGTKRRTAVSEIPAPRASITQAEPEVGQTFETIELISSDGEAISIEPDGAPTVLIFGASWCPPCQPMIEEIALFLDGLDPSVRVFVVAVNDEPGLWSASTDLNVQEVQPGPSFGEVSTVPAVIVLDGTNTITRYDRGAQRLESLFSHIQTFAN